MLTQLFAYFFIILAGLLLTLGNFYFTYGIWPQSWASFVIFSVLNMLLAAAYSAMRMDK